MPQEIFLSYSRKDSAIMHRLRNDLRAAGFTVWTDEGIEPGTPSWKSEIENAIRACDCLVIIFSPDANNSRWVRAEIDFAETLNKPMFPLLARGDRTTSIPFGFSTYQWIDIRRPSDYDSGFQLLADAIQNRLSRLQPGQLTETIKVAEPIAQRSWRRGGLWVSAVVIAVLLVLLAAVLRPNLPSSSPVSTDDAETQPTAAASLTTQATSPEPSPRAVLAPGMPANCNLLSEPPAYERVEPPTISIPAGWVQLRSGAVTLAVPEEYYRPADSEALRVILSSIIGNVLPDFMEFGCEWNLEIFFLQMSGIRGGAVMSRRIGVQLPLDAQQLYFEEALEGAAVVETEFVTLPAGDMLRIEVTLNTESLETKMIGYSISHGPTLYALSFAFAADTLDEHLVVIDQIAQTFQFVDE
ncbi:MAG: toll/interleukin-1 receptor domain-containing protein [Chloroflexi bacterium]|nr:toll/interleukin-1 receptor domain-containing protein [Chloroflexota bacterium]